VLSKYKKEAIMMKLKVKIRKRGAIKRGFSFVGMLIIIIISWTNLALGGPLHVIGGLQINNDSGGLGAGVIFPSGLKQTEACYGTVTSVSAGNGLIASPDPITSSGTLNVSYGGSGGLYGTALSVARSDHSHDEIQYSLICWSAAKTADQDGPVDPPETVLIKAALSKIGVDLYSLHGYAVVPDDNPYLFNGSGVLLNNELFITASGAQEHKNNPWRDAGVMQFRVNKDTMAGSFWATRLDFNTSTRQFDQGYAAGTLTAVSCP
jgi:hypothetical protein